MKAVFLLVLVLTILFTANCRDQVNNFEDKLFPDEPGEDYIFPDEQVDDAFIGEAQHVPMGSENQNINEEVQQMNKNFYMGSVSDHRASMNDRGKKCTPTFLCTRAGGHCVKKRGDCNGALDSNGCKGNKKCQCCIPDDILCGPAPTTVEPKTTMDPTTPIPTTTTTASTTTTSGRSAPWITLGGGYYLFGQSTMNWTSAMTNCVSNGGQLAILNTEAKRIALTDYIASSTNSSDRYWLGGSNLSGTWLFVDNSTVTSAIWNVANSEPDAGSNACMYTGKGLLSAGKNDLALDAPCYLSSTYHPLCEK